MLTSHESPPGNVAKYTLVLADALWRGRFGGSSGRARARELAEQSLAAFEAAGDEGNAAEARAWLATH